MTSKAKRFAGMQTCASCLCTFKPSETTKHEVEGIDVCPNCGEISDVFPSDDGGWDRGCVDNDDGTSNFWRWDGKKSKSKRQAQR